MLIRRIRLVCGAETCASTFCVKYGTLTAIVFNRSRSFIHLHDSFLLINFMEHFNVCAEQNAAVHDELIVQ